MDRVAEENIWKFLYYFTILDYLNVVYDTSITFWDIIAFVTRLQHSEERFFNEEHTIASAQDG